MTTLAPQEIYLLEKFTSPDYLAELRDTWGEIIAHLDNCLEHFMLNLPNDYRKLPLPQQPDVVWGERVLPNFRESYEALATGVIALTHGDLRALRAANGPLNDYKGQREYSNDWMSQNDADRYFRLLNIANTMAGNICATEEAYWKPGILLNYVDLRGSIEIPVDFPSYRLAPNTTVTTNERVLTPGVYIPSIAGSCAQFLNPYNDAPPAIVNEGMNDLLDPSTGSKYGEEPIFEEKSCVWIKVERTQLQVIKNRKLLFRSTDHRVPAGNACPATGYYFTPANVDTRQRFEQGAILPSIKTEYGATIWQWDLDQRD